MGDKTFIWFYMHSASHCDFWWFQFRTRPPQFLHCHLYGTFLQMFLVLWILFDPDVKCDGSSWMVAWFGVCCCFSEWTMCSKQRLRFNLWECVSVSVWACVCLCSHPNTGIPTPHATARPYIKHPTTLALVLESAQLRDVLACNCIGKSHALCIVSREVMAHWRQT